MEDQDDSDTDEDKYVKKVPKVELIRKRGMAQFAGEDGLPASPYPDELNNNKTDVRYSSVPVGPMFYFHWVAKEDSPDLFLKALYEPFNQQMRELVSLMVDQNVVSENSKSSSLLSLALTLYNLHLY